MQKFTRHTGIAAPMLQANIDTDAIIPSREMKAVSKHGMADGLFAGRRYLTPDGREPDPQFVLNQPAYADASILLTGDNFGCGSSREHAVWALKEFGIRVVIAPGFGSIFFSNCISNGLLPVLLAEAEVAELARSITEAPTGHPVTVDLEGLTVACNALRYRFLLEEEQRLMLLHGLDAIALTLRHEQAIADFEARDRRERPWASYPPA
jgi:3-isopropylmalate/(R)-2-methylmalate dehydratase small subunit